jgi:AsmA protein
MKKAIKWLLIVGGGFVALVILALLIVPMFIDVQEYKPRIETMVSDATGRPFRIGGDINLSLFPWVGISLSELHLGNPEGFEEKDFLNVKFFEVRIKLIPLISKDIQVKRFILENPRIVLVKNKSGRGNWEGLGKPPKEKEKTEERGAEEGLPIKSLAVGEVTIKNGSLLWIDHMKGARKEISDLTLKLRDVSLDQPIQLALSANLDGQPMELKGNVGPVGKDPGKGTIPFDFAVRALKELDMNIKGKIVDPATRQIFDLEIVISPFSPRKLVKSLGQDFPVKTADPEALNNVAFSARLKGNPQNVSVSDGTLKLDDSNIVFSAKAKDFLKPDVAFELKLDKIDLDRYLPPPAEKKPAEEEKKTKAGTSEGKKTDYSPLRKLVLDGAIKIGELKAHGAKIQDLYLNILGKNGLFQLDPLSLKLYDGDVSSKAGLDVRKDIPKSHMVLKAKGIKANPLLKDVLNKDILEGTVKASLDIAMAGDDAKKIKSTLNGKGDLFFKDGAIKGIDLAGMVRNAQAAFGLAKRGGGKPRTDFAELHLPFTMTRGIFKTPNATLKSPILRVLAAGKANLVKETLDFRIEPKFVATIKGQGDTKERAGITVPVLVTGTFSSPTFRPDLQSMIKDRLKKALPELKNILSDQNQQEGKPKPLEEKVKDLLKGLPFGSK